MSLKIMMARYSVCGVMIMGYFINLILQLRMHVKINSHILIIVVLYIIAYIHEKQIT